MGRTKGDVDELIRVRISEIIGYGKKHIPTEELFDELGLDYDKRSDYNQIMGVIHKDRRDFCDGIWEPVREMLVDPTYEDYRRAYKKCLENWYLKHRTLLYPYPDGFGTPMKFEELEAFEYEIAQHLARGIINKEENLRGISLQLPYGSEIRQLGNKFSKTPDLKWIPFFKQLTRIFKRMRKIIREVR